MKKIFTKKSVSIILAILLIIGVFIGYKIFINQQTISGSKDITLEVVGIKNPSLIKEYHTDSKLMGELIDQVNKANDKDMKFGLTGKKTDKYGRFINEINGEKSSTTDKIYWTYSIKGSNDYPNAVDNQPIKDKQTYIFKLSK